MHHIRWMIRRDMPEVLAIDKHGTPAPWAEDTFMAHLRRRNCIGMVIEDGGPILGFMVYELSKTSIQLIRLAVHKDYRREGIGRTLIAKLQGKINAQRRNCIVATLTDDDFDSAMFLRCCGFAAHAYREGLFAMRYRIPDVGELALRSILAGNGKVVHD